MQGLLGVGGMGEVYRARDTRLGRSVAIKILPPAFKDDAARLASFEREARLLASLSHPHICALYDVGRDQDTDYLVMELVEGEALSDRLRRSSLPLTQALDLARQIAEALEAAHEKGILHRDLKPANVRLTEKGRVKLLDFGLARALAAGAPGSAEDISDLPTLDSPASPSSGVSGTAPYMSPEQVRGEELDRRTDIWAFGCVLFEMLCGRAAFPGSSAAEAMAAVLEHSPPWPALPDTVPAAIRRLLERCLHKDRAKRLHDVADARLEIEELLSRWERGGGAEREERSPYPGLRSFTEEDAGRFFGREGEVSALWSRITGRRLLAVIGPSGAGKTSFVRAGLVASRPRGWGGLVCTPGARPFAALAHALAPTLAGDAAAVSDLLRIEEPERALAAVSRWRRAHPEALLVVDQFEELFTLNPPEAQARFAALLGRIATDGGVHVLLSMRDDFLFQCHGHKALAPVFDSLTPIGPPDGAALRRALVEPAARQGFAFEDEALVEELLAFVAEERGALPLIAFAVARLWEKRDVETKLLTRAAYREIGGVAGALAQHAEATLESIGSEGQDSVREIFRNLVTAQGTRAVMERGELLSALPVAAAGEEALRRLIDARLLTSYEVEETPDHPSHHRIEVIHESLLAAWPRLVRWQTQDADGAQLRDQLRQAAHLWGDKGRTPDLLWTGTAEREFELWRERYPGRLTAIEDDFARAMVERAQGERRLRRLAAAATIAVLVATVIAISVSRRQAVEQAELARASRLVALGRLELDRYPSAALAYSRASLELADNLEARLLAIEALWRGPATRVIPETSADVAALRADFSPDGGRLALGGFGGTVVVWSEDGRLVQRIKGNLAVADPRGVAFEPGGERLWTFAVRDPSVRAFDASGRLVSTIPAEAQWIRFDASGRLITFGSSSRDPQERVLKAVDPGGGEARVVARWRPSWLTRGEQVGTRVPTAVDPALRWLAYGRNRAIFLHPLEAPGNRDDIELGQHGAAVREILFHKDGSRLLSADAAGEMREWSLALRRPLSFVRESPLHRFSALSLDREGTRVAWFSGGGRHACIWDLRAPPATAVSRLVRGQVTDGGAVVFHPRGTWVASPSYSGTVLWPLGQPDSRVVLVHDDGPIRDLAFSPDSRVLASAARDGLRLVPLSPGGGPPRLVDLGSGYYGYGVAWDPLGRGLALAAPSLGVYSVPVGDDAPRRILDQPSSKMALGPLAYDVAGGQVAVASLYAPSAKDQRLYVIDLTSGAVHSTPLWESGQGEGFAGQTRSVAFDRTGRLVTAGDGGIRRWDLASGRSETILGGPGTFATFAMSADRRKLVVVHGKGFDDLVTIAESDVRVLDLDTGAQRVIRSHGDRLTLAIATDPAGAIIVTGDSSGVVRVGSAEGETPHLLLGHSGPVLRVAVSPDRRWIASASGTEVRLWPMPDLTRSPFHTLPLGELLAKLRALTNLEVVEDPASPTGYKVAIGPFPGWKDVPTW